ncbi:MAG: DUF222 domain-containing protein, partial [Acidimicrobiales bacterium]
RGQITSEQMTKVTRLVDDIGIGPVQHADHTLATLAATTGPTEIGTACDRIRAHVDPDGPEPDPGQDFDRRAITLARVGNMVTLRGQLDLEAGAALLTALDALMKPASGDDTRTAAQRRADALAELARHALTTATLPTVGGVRPQIGIFITPQTLIGHPPPDQDDQTEQAKPSATGATDSHAHHRQPPAPAVPRDNDRAGPHGVAPPSPVPTDPLTEAGYPPLPEPGWMDWIGEIPTALAQRIACDASIWRIVLDPTTGLPLDLGRAYRTAPPWLRKALHARDRGCRWPGCHTPTAWTDAHHLNHWIHGGHTNIDEMLSLCRWHHARVHEGQWKITFNPTTGHVTITRPDGQPYELGPSQPFTTPTTRAA